jgi:hypothetical protein
MLTVHKYPIPLDDIVEIEMPKGAQVLCIDTQHELLQCWALVNPEMPVAKRKFRIAGTGHPILSHHTSKYINSVQMRGGGLVFHIFEILD